MIQKTITKLIMLSIIIFILQACNSELDSYDNSENEQGEISIGDDQKYYTTYYLPSSYSDQTTVFQQKVNALGRGDVLVLKAGSHYISRAITISSNRGITIRGEAGSVIRRLGGLDVTCILIQGWANSVTLNNVYIDGGGGSKAGGSCVIAFGNSNKFLNCTFRNARNAGILFHGSSGNLVDNCKVFYNAGVGISQWRSKYNTIRNSHIYSNGGEGITVDGGSHHSKIHNNIINNNVNTGGGVGGIGIDDADDVSVYNNRIYHNSYTSGSDRFYGIKVQNNLCGGSDRLSIYNNTIYGHSNGAAFGLRRNNQPVSFGRTDGNVAYSNSLGLVYNDTSTAACHY